MEVTESLLAAVPPGNLRVPRAEFGAVWAAAEQLKRWLSTTTRITSSSG